MSEPIDVSVYMRWYVRDYLTAVSHLTAEERGAYSSLLAAMWANHGWLTLDHKRLPLVCGVERERWPDVWAAISGFFQVNDDVRTFTQKRLQEELAEARTSRDARSRAGRAGAAARSSNAQASGAQALLKQCSSKPSTNELALLNPSSVIRHPSEEDPEVCSATGPDYGPEFGRIWADTGRHGNKWPAFKAWDKQGRPNYESVMAGWRHAEKHDRRWPNFIPHLSSWLNDRGWEDRPEGGTSGELDLAAVMAQQQGGR